MTNWENIGKVDIDMKHFLYKRIYFKNIELLIKIIILNLFNI